MTDSEEDPKDWEWPEEVPPERLQRKWETEESHEKPAVACPSCKKRVPADSFQCLYCGGQIFYDSGLLGKILKWIRSLGRDS